jgi:heat shock protein HslJ
MMRSDTETNSVVRYLAVTALVIAIAACKGGETSIGDSSAEGIQGPLTVSELAHATYSGIIDETITLTNGRWEGQPFVEGGESRPTVGLVDHFVLTGDLDADGREEAAMILWESSGGSGNRLYLAAMGRGDKTVVNLGTAFIGDRVQIRSGSIENGKVTLDVVRAGPEDAACCPTQKATLSWALGENGLSQIAEDVSGTVSLADLEGPVWTLIELGWQQPVDDGPEITLSFEKSRVSGNAGCNTYFAEVTATAPGELGFTGMGATRMACPEPIMDLERRYLKALAGCSRYSFLAGRLVLSSVTEEEPQSLVFAPPEPGPEIRD